MEQLRNQILEKVKEYYKQYHEEKNKSFTAGKDMVTFAGRVYDEEEMMNLVDSSLDFWLTTGRYSQEFEIEFAKYMQKKYCLLTTSGSSANLLALTALTSPLLGKRRLKKVMKS